MAKGGLTSKLLNVAIIGLVVLVVLLETYAVVVPTAGAASSAMNATNRCAAESCFYNLSRPIDCTSSNTTASDNRSCATGGAIPLGNLFNATGFIYVIIMAALLMIVIRSFMKKGGK